MPGYTPVLSEDLILLARKVIQDHSGPLSPADLLEGIGNLIEAGEIARHQATVVGPTLARFGLSPGQFNDMATAAKYAELEAEGDVEAGGRHEGPASGRGPIAERLGWLYSREARRTSVALYLRGLEPDVVASALDLDPARVLATIENRPSPHPLEREFVLRALVGTPTAVIARETGASYRTIERAIERAGLKSVPLEDRKRQRSVRQRIIALRNEGKSYPEIQEATGANTNQVRNALRWAQAKGILTYSPGAKRSEDPAGAKRSEQAA